MLLGPGVTDVTNANSAIDVQSSADINNGNCICFSLYAATVASMAHVGAKLVNASS
jgi:hypothetical protein